MSRLVGRVEKTTENATTGRHKATPITVPFRTKTTEHTRTLTHIVRHECDATGREGGVGRGELVERLREDVVGPTGGDAAGDALPGDLQAQGVQHVFAEGGLGLVG